MRKSRFADSQLPDFLKSERVPDQAGFIGFPDTGSEIRALPSTIKAGHGTDASMVTYDEADFHDFFETSFAAVKPTIDAGGLMVVMSKRDNEKAPENSLFTQLYSRAKAGEGNFKAIFLHALVVPHRTLEWVDYASKDLPEWQRKVAYPLTEEDFLYTPGIIRFYDGAALDNMDIRSLPPIEHELSDRFKTLRIYKPSIIGARYCMFADPSEGKEDPHVIIVKDAQTGEEVACSFGMIPAEQCGLIHDELFKYYNKAYNSFETNSGAGRLMRSVIMDLGTSNIHVQKKGYIGWWTSESAKRDMIWGLEDEIRNMKIQIHTPEARAQLRTIVQMPGKNPGVPKGGHDDFMSAWGGLSQISKDMKFGEFQIQSFAYKA